MAVDEAEQVERWHTQFLIELGVDPTLASDHASDVDPHAVAILIRDGCPPDLALEIRLLR